MEDGQLVMSSGSPVPHRPNASGLARLFGEADACFVSTLLTTTFSDAGIPRANPGRIECLLHLLTEVRCDENLSHARPNRR